MAKHTFTDRLASGKDAAAHISWRAALVLVVAALVAHFAFQPWATGAENLRSVVAAFKAVTSATLFFFTMSFLFPTVEEPGE